MPKSHARSAVFSSALTLILAVCIPIRMSACEPGAFQTAITDTEKTLIRRGSGEWNAPRDGGAHQGVDLITNASHDDPLAYAVSPVAAGTVAYSRLNGSETTGYGNLVVVDHGNDCYSLYGHLASSPTSPMTPGGNLLVQIGDAVTPDTVLGYFVDIRSDVDSTGNARRTAPEARHQVHFELISAPSGRRGAGKLVDTILKSDAERHDPTPLLIGLGYQIR